MSITTTRRLLLSTCAGVALAVVGLTGCSAGVTDGDSPAGAVTTSTSGSSAGSASGTGGAGSSGTGIVPSVVVPDVSNLPTGLPTTTGAGGATGGGTPGDASLPAGFPLPPGASVIGVTRDAGEIAGRLALADGTQAYEFWKLALPNAGYTVSSAEAAAGYGEIRFSGQGCTGNSQIALTGTTAAVQCDLG